MEISKKIMLPASIILGVFVVAIIVSAILWNTVLKIDLVVEAEQVEQQQMIDVGWDASKSINKVEITVTHKGDIVSKQIITNKKDIYAGKTQVYAYYGKQNVEVKVYDSGFYSTAKSTTVNVSADKYVIAPITATMPVTMFTLSLNTITDNFQTPTFVWFKRSGAWDWANLPQNVYAMPVANMDEFLHSDENRMYSKTSEWVKELYEINNDSQFDFYYNDYFAFGWLDATIANKIPKSNYHVTLLSDGTASFSYFNEHFDNDNHESEYAKMKNKWEKVKSQVAKNGSFTMYSRYEIGAWKLREYAYVMATEEDNVDWWLTRTSGTMATHNEDMYDELSHNTSVKVKDLKGLLTALDEDGQQMVKTLYHFSDTMFEKAHQENKNIMIILGTWTETEKSTDFDGYVKSLIAYYGDDYIYYYKGHPRNPTNSEPGKLENLTKLGLIDVDSTIAAELLLFFNPDAFVSGYDSTTFVSAQADKCCALFNITKDAFDGSYKDNMQVFITKLSADNPLSTGDSCYLIEIANSTEYDIAVYDAKKDKLTYYPKN